MQLCDSLFEPALVVDRKVQTPTSIGAFVQAHKASCRDGELGFRAHPRLSHTPHTDIAAGVSAVLSRWPCWLLAQLIALTRTAGQAHTLPAAVNESHELLFLCFSLSWPTPNSIMPRIQDRHQRWQPMTVSGQRRRACCTRLCPSTALCAHAVWAAGACHRWWLHHHSTKCEL